MKKFDFSFFKGKKILLTGHTGFKGSWMSKILVNFGADLTGYSLCSNKEESLFKLTNTEENINHVKGDIRDLAHLKKIFNEVKPEIVIHMAAQPIVRESYKNPIYTYETNVIGTANILECVRLNTCVKSFLNVTTDKVYENKEWLWGYRENDILDGFDPYSNSKSCSELVTSSYKRSFFNDMGVPISTARAGNVIGGGDFAKDRIIPDCVRSVKTGKKIIVRNPYSIRPYQHVLEPLFAYLMIVKAQYEDPSLSGSYNIGPDECDCVSTGELVNLFCEKWGSEASWEAVSDKSAPHEANFLKLDCSKMKKTFGWSPVWHIDTAVEKICEWTMTYLNGKDIATCMDSQIIDFINS